MIEVRQTVTFRDWLAGLRDRNARQQIVRRIVRIQAGLLGDVKYFDGIGELRFHGGPGYRVYFARRGDTVVILLAGGDKGSQKRDINQAKRIAESLE